MKKYEQKIIDGHMHFWDLSLKKHQWLLEPNADFFLGDYTNLKKTYLPSDYRQDSQNFNIEKTVHIQGGWDRNDIAGEAKWINQINDGLIGAIVPYADFSSKNIDEQLAELSQVPLVRGIRQITAWHENSYYSNCEKNFIADATWAKNLSKLKNYDLLFDLQIYPSQAEEAYQLVKNNEQIIFVLEHSLQPLQHDAESLKHWQTIVAKFAKLPNTFIKLSGLRLFVHQPNFADFKQIIETCVDSFSPHRCLIASNFPVEKLYLSFDQLYENFFAATAQYNNEEKDALFYNTAKKVYLER